MSETWVIHADEIGWTCVGVSEMDLMRYMDVLETWVIHA